MTNAFVPTMGRPSTPRRRLVGWLLVLSFATSLVAASGGTASAHRNNESYLYLDVGDSTLTGRVELTYPDMREVLGFELSGSADEQLAELEQRLPELLDYTAARTSVGDSNGSWPLQFGDVELLFEVDVDPGGTGYAIIPFDVDLQVAEVPQIIDVTFSPFLEEVQDRNNIALVSNDWKRGVIDQETNELAVLTADSPSTTIDLGDANQWRNFRASIDLGVDHIRTGPDHIFFVFVLLLPSVLVLLAGAWKPAPSFNESLLRVIAVATMFTIAHSLTFTLAGLDILPLPPPKLVEALIAASIAAAALHNVKPIFGHREWSLAFVFGLFHGMGFAGLVEDLDIDRSTQLYSLLGRNVGIEIGQLVIILITFPALFLLRRTRAYLPLMYTASIGLAGMSSLWVVERVFEVDIGFNGAVDKALQWPRSLSIVIALTVVVVIYRRVEEHRGRLLPLVQPESEGSLEASDEDDRETIDV
jgi:hypothetical protein